MAAVPAFAFHKGTQERPSLRQVARQALYATYLAVLFLEVVERHGFCIPVALVLGLSVAGHLRIAVYRHLRDSAFALADGCHAVLLTLPAPSRQGLQRLLYAALLLELLVGPWRSLPCSAYICIVGVALALSAARLASHLPRLPRRRRSAAPNEVMGSNAQPSAVPRPTRWLMERLLLGVLSLEMLLHDQWPRALCALLTFLAKLFTACLGLWLSRRYMPAIGHGVVFPVFRQMMLIARWVHDRISTARLKRELRHLTQWPSGHKVPDASSYFSLFLTSSHHELAQEQPGMSRDPAMSSSVFSDFSENFLQGTIATTVAAHAESNLQRLASVASSGARYGHSAVEMASSTVSGAVRTSAALVPVVSEAALEAACGAADVTSSVSQAVGPWVAEFTASHTETYVEANERRPMAGPLQRRSASPRARRIFGEPVETTSVPVHAAPTTTATLFVLPALSNLLPAAVCMISVALTTLTEGMHAITRGATLKRVASPTQVAMWGMKHALSPFRR